MIPTRESMFDADVVEILDRLRADRTAERIKRNRRKRDTMHAVKESEPTTTLKLNREDILALLRNLTGLSVVPNCPHCCLQCGQKWTMHPTLFVPQPSCADTCLAERIRSAGRKLV